MAGNNESITLNLQDFIPYPLKILHLSDLIGTTTTSRESRSNSSSQSVPGNPSTGKSATGNKRINSETKDECPFDCCQKNLHQVYFPDCELTNATIKMNIGSGIGNLLSGKGGGVGSSAGIPCLERRTIYEGRVTDMPVKFEELLKESGAAQGEDIVVDRNNTSSLAINELHAQQQQHQQLRNIHHTSNNNPQMGIKDSTAAASTLRLTFHQQQQNQHQVAYARALAAAAAASGTTANSLVGAGIGNKEGIRNLGRTQPTGGIPTSNMNVNHSAMIGEDQYHYMWDSRKSGWTWTKANMSNNNSERYTTSNMMPYSSLSQQNQLPSPNSIGSVGRSGHQYDGWNSQQQQQLHHHQLQQQQQQLQQHNQFEEGEPGGVGAVVGASGNEYWDKRDVEHMHSLWLKQQQLHSQPQQRFRKQGTGTMSNSSTVLDYNNVDQGGNIISSKRAASSCTSSDNQLGMNSNVESNVDQQLNSYLKSYKYMKPSVQQGYPGMHIGGSITRGSPMTQGNNNKTSSMTYPIGNNPTKAAREAMRSRQSSNNMSISHHQQEQLNLKRSISPRTALEQFERLEKYWNYQHQLLEAEDFPHHSGGDVNRQQQQQSTSSASVSATYGGQTPAKLLRTGAASSATSATTANYPSQQEIDIRGYAGLSVGGSSSGGIIQPTSSPAGHSHAQSYGGGNSQGPSSSATWGSVYGGRTPISHYGSSNQSATTANPGIGIGTSAGSSGANLSSSGNGNQECNWAVSVIEISPQSFPPNKQSIAGSLHQQGANTTLVSKERLINMSRSAAAAAVSASTTSSPSVSLGASKTRDMCKAITSSDVSNLYCTTINRVPARDLNLNKTTDGGGQVASKVIDSFEYNKAVLIGPISNNETEHHPTSLEAYGSLGRKLASSSSALELSKLAKNHERQKLLESKQTIAPATLLSNKKTNYRTSEDIDVPRDLTVPRRSRSDDGILLRKEIAAEMEASRIGNVGIQEKALGRKDTTLIDEVSRRNSDDPVTMSRMIEGALILANMPERSKSTPGSNHDTVYDHIVLLDKRVKTYMCKRCLETLKSEQEIRNHLFCKMLSNTVQCHVCRHLFTSEEYPQHLQLHAVNAKQ